MGAAQENEDVADEGLTKTRRDVQTALTQAIRVVDQAQENVGHYCSSQ